MKRLPHWCITDKFPALYDTESATVIEQTAKLYGAMNELIDEYNTFVDKINETIEEFETSTNKNYELFTVSMRQEFQDFIDTVELKIQSQDKVIADAVNYMVTNLRSQVSTEVNKYINEGVAIGVNYNEENEALSIVAVNVDSNGNYIYDSTSETIDLL